MKNHDKSVFEAGELDIMFKVVIYLKRLKTALNASKSTYNFEPTIIVTEQIFTLNWKRFLSKQNFNDTLKIGDILEIVIRVAQVLGMMRFLSKSIDIQKTFSCDLNGELKQIAT